MNFLTSPKLSLFCSVVNVLMAITSLFSGQYFWSIVCLLLAGVCYENYLNAEER
jgi:hypothetical protein